MTKAFPIQKNSLYKRNYSHYLRLFVLLISTNNVLSFQSWFQQKTSSLFSQKPPHIQMIQQIDDKNIPSWDELERMVKSTPKGRFLEEQKELRERGEGLPHTDAKLRLFGTKGEPRITLYRDSAAWCPYCQKVWIMLEEKRIPYKVEKVNMRCYGDKPASYLRMVPSGAVPAITIDGRVQTESLDIMLLLEKEFRGPDHPQLLPHERDPEYERAMRLMKLERDLFSKWWNLVFRPSSGLSARTAFESCLDVVDRELSVTAGPWFLESFSIVDLSFIPFLERMCASVAYWSGLKIRGDGRWRGIERWFEAFESLPSYMATKSDFYTHVKDLPPQCGRAYSLPGSKSFSTEIDGQGSAWRLPLPPFQPNDLQVVSPIVDPGEENARHEAAFKLICNCEAVVRFALRGAGLPGKINYGAPLSDPTATPNLDYYADMDAIIRSVSLSMLTGDQEMPIISTSGKSALQQSLAYLRDRVGVPRDMSYPAARQLRAYLQFYISRL